MEVTTCEWSIDGMTCQTCSLNVKKVLEGAGYSNVQVSLATKSARFTINEVINESEVKAELKRGGYTVLEANASGEGHKNLALKFWFSAVLTAPLLLHMWVHWHWLHHPLVQFILSTPVFILGWQTFGRGAFYSIRKGSSNMDVLILMGASAAYCYSIANWIMGDIHNMLYFETTASIICFVLLGEFIEDRSIHKTNAALRALLQLQEPKAKLWSKNLISGEVEIQEIDAIQIAPGDRLQVNTGDRIATDGIVWQGEVLVDESMLTGESNPIQKKQNDSLTGGTIVLDGSAVMKAQTDIKNNRLAHIIELMKQAQSDLPPIQKLADKISSWFVPTVLTVALLVLASCLLFFHLSFADSILRSIAVLVISCPCAMGLATPLAVMAGVGKASRYGILFKGNQHMQALADSKTWLMDKTGTLTVNSFSANLYSWTEEQFSLVKSMEMHSSHPIAKAIVVALNNYPTLRLKNIQEVKGEGLKAEDLQGRKIALGTYKLIEHAPITEFPINLYIDGIWQLGFSLEESIKEGAANLVSYAKANNIKIVMLSGDKKERCLRVANELGIEEVLAEQKPEDKLNTIKKYRNAGPVAMLGDGINDAPALAAAHVGISIHASTATAMESAHIILMRDDIYLLADAHTIAKGTMRTIYTNFGWALLYNIIAIPAAAFGFVAPLWSALSMTGSDVVLVINSLALNLLPIKRRK
jgi:Cu+-exporting ATPase